MSFIDDIAPFIQKYAPKYGIAVCSPIIAQGILESASGTSPKAKYHNYFGLKYRNNRVSCNNGYFEAGGSEQNKDGTYTNLPSSTAWYSFEDMEHGVEGYFQFINIANYANLKGVTEPETYLKNIKADEYATSLKYVENLMAVIELYGLTKYDIHEEGGNDKKMVINVHAGHNPDGKTACGAVGLIKESTEARNVKNAVISKLQKLGHTVYDCTVDDGKSQSDVLQKIVAKCNAHKVDLDISIHFNAGVNDTAGNGITTGTEVFVYSSTSKAKEKASAVVNAIAELGYKNRGVKTSSSLYVLKNTKAPSMLCELCFVNDRDDVNLYSAEKMATAIVKGITGQSVASTQTPVSTTPQSSSTQTSTGCPFIVKCLDNLNIRKTPGGEIVKVNGCKKGTKYTIVKTSGNWGYLKSGAGWISIHSKYVSKE